MKRVQNWRDYLNDDDPKFQEKIVRKKKTIESDSGYEEVYKKKKHVSKRKTYE